MVIDQLYNKYALPRNSIDIGTGASRIMPLPRHSEPIYGPRVACRWSRPDTKALTGDTKESCRQRLPSYWLLGRATRRSNARPVRSTTHWSVSAYLSPCVSLTARASRTRGWCLVTRRHDNRTCSHLLTERLPRHQRSSAIHKKTPSFYQDYVSCKILLLLSL